MIDQCSTFYPIMLVLSTYQRPAVLLSTHCLAPDTPVFALPSAVIYDYTLHGILACGLKVFPTYVKNVLTLKLWKERDDVFRKGATVIHPILLYTFSIH
jgi:hypothetical protein